MNVSSCSGPCCLSRSRAFISFSNDKLRSGTYWAIIHLIQLRTTWWHQWRRQILKDDSSVGVTTVTSKYKCCYGKFSAHTSRLGLYRSPTAGRGWEQLSWLPAVRSTEAGKRGEIGNFPGEFAWRKWHQGLLHHTYIFGFAVYRLSFF